MFHFKLSQSFLFSIGLMCICGEPALRASSLYDFKVQSIDDEQVSLKKYQGQVALVVNTASKCGYTSQYEGLQALYQKYQSKGFVVLGFPSNDFGNQEPGVASEIKSFCKSSFGVTFPLFAKGSVRGKNKQELFKWLTDDSEKKELRGEITWNFHKFLIDRSGKLVARFASGVDPSSSELIKAIESALIASREN